MPDTMQNANEGAYLALTPRPKERLLSYKIGNLQGIGSRARQEDSFTVMNSMDVTAMKEKGLFFSVCDGMGGMKDGKLASETAIASLRQSFTEMDRSGSIPAQLVESAYTASSKVEALIGGDGGSTLIECVLFGGKLYYCCVGDSFLFLYRNNELIMLNSEHTLLHDREIEAIQDGDVNPLQFQNLPEATALTGFLGMIGLDKTDSNVIPINLHNGDIIMACSDGVGGVLSEEEIKESLELSDVNHMCSDLEQKVIAHHRPHQDNFTAVVVQCIR
jgi:protein phosphatase